MGKEKYGKERVFNGARAFQGGNFTGTGPEEDIPALVQAAENREDKRKAEGCGESAVLYCLQGGGLRAIRAKRSRKDHHPADAGHPDQTR